MALMFIPVSEPQIHSFCQLKRAEPLNGFCHVSSIQKGDHVRVCFSGEPSNASPKYGYQNPSFSGEAAAASRRPISITKTEKHSSWDYRKKRECLILRRAVCQVARGGESGPLLLVEPEDPAGSSGPGLRLGVCLHCQVPVLSFVKQTGDVTVDYASMEENILADNTSEVEKCFSTEDGVVWMKRVTFPLITDTGQMPLGSVGLWATSQGASGKVQGGCMCRASWSCPASKPVDRAD